MRVFVDTNFLISSLIFKGFSADVFRYILTQHEVVLSEQVKQELSLKLKVKIKLTDKLVQQVMAALQPLELVANHSEATYPLRDKDDEIILASAIQSKCDVLITGDKDLLEVSDGVNEISILSPRQFWEKYHGN